MKQSKLAFSAEKRTVSTASTGKAKSNTGSTTPRLKTTSSQPASSPPVATETSSKATEQVAEEVKDEIEPAEDLVINDSESVSSISTWETLEENPNTTIDKATPAAATPAKNKSTASANARVTRSASQKKVVPGTSSKVQQKVEEVVKSPFKQSNATDEQVEQTVQSNSQKTVEQSVEQSVEANPQTRVEQPGQATPQTPVPQPAQADSQPPVYPDLKLKAKYNKYHDQMKAKTGDVPTIHAEKETKIHQILRFFDTSYEYGPCVGVSRRQRWDRAQALGLNPPKEVDEILNTKQGRELSEYSESVFYGQV